MNNSNGDFNHMLKMFDTHKKEIRSKRDIMIKAEAKKRANIFTDSKKTLTEFIEEVEAAEEFSEA